MSKAKIEDSSSYKEVISIVDKILKENKSYSKIEGELKRLLVQIEEVITQLSVIVNHDYKIRVKEFNNIKDKSKNILKECEYLINNEFENISKCLSHFTMLTYKYHKLENYLVEIDSLNIADNIKELEKKNQDLINKTKGLNRRVGGIVGSVLSAIFSVSFISSIFLAVDKINSSFIPLFFISMIFVGFTFILMINGIFNEEIKVKKEVWRLYFVLLSIFIITFVLTFILVIKHVELIK